MRAQMAVLGSSAHSLTCPVHELLFHDRIPVEESIGEECNASALNPEHLPIRFELQIQTVQYALYGLPRTMQLPLVVSEKKHIVHVSHILALWIDLLLDLSVDIGQYEIRIPMGYIKSYGKCIIHTRKNHAMKPEKSFVLENSFKGFHDNPRLA